VGVNLLLSYAFHADTRLDEVRKDMVCGQIMIDSGAFTAWSKGREIKLTEYATYLQRWVGCWDHAITLDVIGDPAASRVNTHRLHGMGLPVMPVFTRNDTLAEFDAMVTDVGYVAVGGLVGLPAVAQRARAGMLQRRALDAGGGIHALGIGSMSSLRAVRPYSADASSVSGAFRFGTVVYFDGREIRNTSVTDTAKLTRDRAHIQAHGINLLDIAKSGRMPDRTDGGRQKLMQAMSLAYAAADEYLKKSGPVPPPRSGSAPGPYLYSSVIGQGGSANDDVYSTAVVDRWLHAGPHLYNSVTPGFGIEPASGLDRHLHAGGEVPSIWRIHGRTHTCRAKDTK
jgi:hypothetical protein